MKSLFAAAALGAALAVGLAGAADARLTNAGRCRIIKAHERTYDRAHHIPASDLAGRCERKPGNANVPSPRMFKDIYCHANGIGVYCCVWTDDHHSPSCGYEH